MTSFDERGKYAIFVVKGAGEISLKTFDDKKKAIERHNLIRSDFPDADVYFATKEEEDLPTHVKLGDETIELG